MIESAAYDVIKEEGLSEGLQQGKIQEARGAILDNLEARFEMVPGSIVKEVQEIDELGVLKALHRGSVKVATLDEFIALLQKATA